MEHKVHHRVRRRPPMVHNLIQMDQLYSFTHYDISVMNESICIRILL